jgi:hypothetical protein
MNKEEKEGDHGSGRGSIKLWVEEEDNAMVVFSEIRRKVHPKNELTRSICHLVWKGKYFVKLCDECMLDQ